MLFHPIKVLLMGNFIYNSISILWIFGNWMNPLLQQLTVRICYQLILNQKNLFQQKDY